MKTIKHLLIIMAEEGKNYTEIDRSPKLNINHVLQWLSNDREYKCKLGEDAPPADSNTIVYPYSNEEKKERAGYALTLLKHCVNVSIPFRYDNYAASLGTNLSQSFLQKLTDTKYSTLYECYEDDNDCYIRFGDTVFYIVNYDVCNKKGLFNELQYIMKGDRYVLPRFVKKALQGYSKEEVEMYLESIKKEVAKVRIVNNNSNELLEQEYGFLHTVLQEVVANEND